MKYFLTENYSVEENCEGNLRQTLASVSSRTKFELIEPAGITLFSLLREPAEDATAIDVVKIKPAFADMRMFLPQKNPADSYFSPEKGNIGSIPITLFLENGCPKEVIDELKTIGYFFQITTQTGVTVTLIPTKGFLATFCRFAGVGKLEEGIDPMRDVYLASRLVYSEPFTLVYRTNEKMGRAFGCFSSKFGKQPQSIIWDFKEYLMKKNPDITVRHWEYTHSVTNVDFSLNNKVFRVGKMRVTPGVRLSLSDIGDSSYTLRCALYCNGSMVTLPEVISRKRTGTLDVKDMVHEFYEDCLPEVEKIARICEQSANIPVKNQGEKVLSIMKSIGLEAAVGKAIFPTIRNQYEEKSEAGTLADVLTAILKIPGSVKAKSCKSYLVKVSECTGKAFTIKDFTSLI